MKKKGFTKLTPRDGDWIHYFILEHKVSDSQRGPYVLIDDERNHHLPVFYTRELAQMALDEIEEYEDEDDEELTIEEVVIEKV